MSNKALYLEYWKVLQNSKIRKQQPLCSSSTVVAVINTVSKSSLGKKGFLWFYTSASLKEVRAGIQPGAEAQTVEQHCMHACFPGSSFLSEPGLSAQRWHCPPLVVVCVPSHTSQQEQVPQTCPQASLREVVYQLKLPQKTWDCQVDSHLMLRRSCIKWTKYLKRYFTSKEKWIAYQHMKLC